MDKFWEWFTAGLCMVGLMFAAVLCYRMLPPSTKDFWDIVAAIGSAGAAVAAVWIATRDGRRRKVDEMAAARLAAGGIAYRANTALNHVNHVLEWLEKFGDTVPGHVDFGRYADLLTEGDLWTNEELLQLIPLPNDCASKLAVAAAQIHTAAVIMRRTYKDGAQVPTQLRLARATELHKMLLLCLDRLNSAVKTCREEAGIFKKVK